MKNYTTKQRDAAGKLFLNSTPDNKSWIESQFFRYCNDEYIFSDFLVEYFNL